jgi:hypothetical protein
MSDVRQFPNFNLVLNRNRWLKPIKITMMIRIRTLPDASNWCWGMTKFVWELIGSRCKNEIAGKGSSRKIQNPGKGKMRRY